MSRQIGTNNFYELINSLDANGYKQVNIEAFMMEASINKQIYEFSRVWITKSGHIAVLKEVIYYYDGRVTCDWYHINANEVNTDTQGKHVVRVNGKNYQHKRLIAIAHVPNPENKPYVTVIDDTKPLYANNLAWATAKEIGTRTQERGTLKKTRNNLGRYYDSIGCLVEPDGNCVPMSFDAYIELVEQKRGKAIANKVRKRHEAYKNTQKNRMAKKCTTIKINCNKN